MVSAKAYKVQDVNRKKRVGIVANSLSDLKHKGSTKLGLTVLCETKRNETKRNGTLRNGTLRNGYNTMLHHTLSRVPRIPLKAEDL